MLHLASLQGEYGDWLLKGVGLTLLLTAASWLLAFGLGTALAVVRMLPWTPGRIAVGVYVAYHRNVPMLVQLLVWYFGAPSLLPASVQLWLNSHGGGFLSAMVALGLGLAAYVCEDIRSGVRTVPSGQWEAARSMGLGQLGAFRHVVLPQAFRVATPALVNQTLLLFKNSSLAMAIGVAELTYMTREIESATFRTFEIYAVATLLYLVGSATLMLLGRRIELNFVRGRS